MPFPDALNNAKTATQTENTRDSAREDTPHAHTVSTVSRPRKMGEEEVQLRMPRSFDFGDHGSAVPREAGAGIPEFMAAEAAEMMMVWTRTPASNFIRFDFRFPCLTMVPGPVQYALVPLLPSRT